MKAINGMLRVDQKYSLIGNDYLGGFEGSGYSQCENCGKPIANIAMVKGSDDAKTYHIGIDCASTLTSINPNEILQAKKELARKAKFVKFLKTECKTVIISGKPDNDTAWAYSKEVEKWESFWRIRFVYSFWKNIISKLNIRLIVD